VVEHLPGSEPAERADRLAYYAGSFALFQVGGEPWQRWSDALLAHALASQRQDGNFAGSWDPVGMEAKSGGRLAATMYMTLALAVQARFAAVQARAR
jgi:hypothetical protein